METQVSNIFQVYKINKKSPKVVANLRFLSRVLNFGKLVFCQH